MGYLNDGARTAEAITPDGFLRSGDLGYVDGEGYLHITGRRKEILITAGGENVAPVRLHPARVGAPVLIAADPSFLEDSHRWQVPIENVIKEELPFVSHAVLVCDRRKFVSCLLTLKASGVSRGVSCSRATAG